MSSANAPAKVGSVLGIRLEPQALMTDQGLRKQLSKCERPTYSKPAQEKQSIALGSREALRLERISPLEQCETLKVGRAQNRLGTSLLSGTSTRG